MRRSRWSSIGVTALLTVLVTPGSAAATHDVVACADVSLVFARGSGQSLGAGEATRFFSATGAQIGTATRVNAYEVGTQPHGGTVYPAVGVGTDSAASFANLIGADASWTGLGRYNRSVAAGVTETAAYLSGRAARCPAERFVVAGYSQGAQVVGNALAASALAVRDRVRYVGLFGDPKLSLPEGRGIYPPACRGSSLSPWRRGDVGCFTDNGVLEARVPYLPSDLVRRTGSWCDRGDPICTNNLLAFRGSTHSDYDLPGNGIDAAAQEAALALAGQTALAATVPALTTAPDRTELDSAAVDRDLELTIGEYWAAPGEPVTFRATGLDAVHEVLTYRWDLDGDRKIDVETPDAAITHTYDRPFNGAVRLVVRTKDGQRSSATAQVHIDDRGLADLRPTDPTRTRTKVLRQGDGTRDVQIVVPGGRRHRADVWKVYDRSGQLVAITDGRDTQTIVLTDVPAGVDLAVIAASNRYGTSRPLAVDLP